MSTWSRAMWTSSPTCRLITVRQLYPYSPAFQNRSGRVDHSIQTVRKVGSILVGSWPAESCQCFVRSILARPDREGQASCRHERVRANAGHCIAHASRGQALHRATTVLDHLLLGLELPRGCGTFSGLPSRSTLISLLAEFIPTARFDSLTGNTWVQECVHLLRDGQVGFPFGKLSHGNVVRKLLFANFFHWQGFKNESILVHSFSLIERAIFLDPTNVDIVCELGYQNLLQSMLQSN